MRARHALVLAATALLALAGCHDPVTEIVVVVDTDYAPSEINILELDIDAQGGPIRQQFVVAGSGVFPATVGLLPADAGGAGPFTITAAIFGFKTKSAVLPPLVSRKVSGVRFVKGAVRMLYLSLPRACGCEGTSCPNALTAACADTTAPTLEPFDPAHLPHLPRSDGGVMPDGGGAETSGGGGATGADAARDTASDVALEMPGAPPEAGPEVAAPGDARDAADAVPEAPAKLARGHACGAGDVCADGFCVDGVCCESACTCGTCNATPGTCAAAAAGTDPHGDCGAYACNGARACETMCPEGFGACSAHCGAAAHCDGAGKCAPSTSEVGFFCVAGSCMCKPGLSCPAPDGGGAGKCQ